MFRNFRLQFQTFSTIFDHISLTIFTFSDQKLLTIFAIFYHNLRTRRTTFDQMFQTMLTCSNIIPKHCSCFGSCSLNVFTIFYNIVLAIFTTSDCYFSTTFARFDHHFQTSFAVFGCNFQIIKKNQTELPTFFKMFVAIPSQCSQFPIINP